jgi:hypothetical protein
MTDREWLELALAPTCQEERDAVNKGPGPLRMWMSKAKFRLQGWLRPTSSTSALRWPEHGDGQDSKWSRLL